MTSFKKLTLLVTCEHKSWATKFCTVVPRIFGSSVWNLPSHHFGTRYFELAPRCLETFCTLVYSSCKNWQARKLWCVQWHRWQHLCRRITRVVGVWPQCRAIPLSANSGPFLPAVHLLWASVNKHASYCYVRGHSVKSHISGQLWIQFVNILPHFKLCSLFSRLWWFLSMDKTIHYT